MHESTLSQAAAFALAPALALGSFLNVVVARVPARRSLVSPPSSCATCATELLWRDNIPILSWALLRGRCRHCEGRISIYYPAVETVTALLVVTSVAVLGPTPEGLLAACFSAVLVTLSAIDMRHRIVPTRIVVPAAIAAVAFHTAIDPSLAWLGWSLVAAAALFLVVLAHPNGLGIGAVQVALLLGAVLGSTVTVALVIGLCAALAPSAVRVSRRGASVRKLSVPLVPFLSLGAVIALFTGSAIFDACRGLL
jgi:prepilin signal peptidase PulO-like enzyme (type II secretory pathway)